MNPAVSYCCQIMLVKLKPFQSKYVLPRQVDVWLPPDYGLNPEKKYPVIYMQDGQFSFLSVRALVGWGLDDVLLQLIKENKIPEVIIVAVWHTANRWLEYAPNRPVETFFDEAEQLGLKDSGFYPDGDNYLNFLIHELKPFIDSEYAVLKDCKNTFLLGSSMGAVISAYGICEYPDVFGGAGCISTHWPIYKGIMVDYLEKYLPVPGKNKFYFDMGSENIDSSYGRFQSSVDVFMGNKGFRDNVDWMSRRYDGDHSALAWSKRVHIPLTFLLNSAS